MWKTGEGDGEGGTKREGRGEVREGKEGRRTDGERRLVPEEKPVH
jgi:hypothetical protein